MGSVLPVRWASALRFFLLRRPVKVHEDDGDDDNDDDDADDDDDNDDGLLRTS